MLRAVSSIALAALLAACASGQPRTPRQMIDRALAGSNIAVPGEVVAAELAFARMAREEGQWTAFRKFATEDAVMFVPEPVNARDWLAKQKDPAESVRWQPHQVWMSCDGSLAVTKGAWQRPDGSFGYFTTVWERQPNGEYKWVLDQGDVLTEPLAAPDIIESTVADCGEPESGDGLTCRMTDMIRRGEGHSIDYTLSYEWAAYADGSRDLAVSMMKDNQSQQVLVISVGDLVP